MSKETEQIGQILEGLYKKYNHRRLIEPDPLQFVYRYDRPADMEVVGLLASALAYGRVQQIEKSLEKLFGYMGTSPCEFILNFDSQRSSQLKDFKHRFTTGQDISDLLFLLKKVFSQYGSIENFFTGFYNSNDENVIPALTAFCDSLYDMYAEDHDGEISRGLKYLLANPAGGSACKRLNLFLRWMVREDDVDTGLWKTIDRLKLVVPIDVHMGRLCRILGFYSRKTVTLSAAIEVTQSFAKIEPADPVKYDFALSRIGIVENCSGRCRSGCEVCELFDFCS